MPTRSFLFVDQVRSTDQLTRLGDARAHEVRRALFDLLRQATEVAGGHEVDFTGDGLSAPSTERPRPSRQRWPCSNWCGPSTGVAPRRSGSPSG